MNDAFLFENEYQLDASDSLDVITLNVDSASVGKRIDAFIAENSDLTPSATSSLIIRLWLKTTSFAQMTCL